MPIVSRLIRSGLERTDNETDRGDVDEPGNASPPVFELLKFPSLMLYCLWICGVVFYRSSTADAHLMTGRRMDGLGHALYSVETN